MQQISAENNVKVSLKQVLVSSDEAHLALQACTFKHIVIIVLSEYILQNLFLENIW